ncbi:M48 family metallopeptidase [Caulobacter sp.]|uniref:M48 family metallopeptidase n=1 Tax=Caulobacter sp. TaxID=78 RepID=UPI001B1EF3CD|nr:M48 family metallopeptidase [Caulobacter sp.]MBO9545075.1 M48 family metallopeptidase [Caulobacter sp.]
MAQSFDPAAATAAYLAQLPPEAHAKAQHYTQGGHWLLLWGFIVSVLVAWIVIRTGVLTRLQNGVEKTKPRPFLASLVVASVYVGFSWALELPWSVYANWWREKQYGLTSQAFGGWLGQNVMATTISVVFTALFLALLYLLIRKARRLWWLWAGGLTAGFIIFGMLIAPIYIEPLFNKYTPAPPGPVRDEVVAMAKQVGIPHDKIFVYDGSRQSNAYTANVSGLGGSARVAMSDVMFKKGADIAEVRGVVGHEMGHYAHQHSLWITSIFSVLAVVAFFIADRVFPWFATALNAKGVTGIADPAGLPVLAVIMAVLGLVGGPITNTLIREVESDADRYSLVHFNEPDGLAKALVKTIEYRAATPSKLEEVLFYDHPAVSVRVRRAMDWKATHPKAPD